MVKRLINKVSKSVLKTEETAKEDLRFEIDQLRKDKMIYALESIACTLAALLFLVGISIYLPRQYAQSARSLYNLGFGVAIGYWLFTVYGNTKRLKRIRKLEKELADK